MLPLASRRLTFLALTSATLALFIVDQATPWLDPARLWLNRALSPLFEVAQVPSLGRAQGVRILQSKQELIQDIAHLETQALARAFELQKVASIRAENEVLRTLLDLKPLSREPLIVAQVLLTRITPLHHKIVVNRGKQHGVLVDSIVFDADGIVGQVHFVSEKQSWVTLITDPNHGVPALVERSNISGVIQGTGELNRLMLQYVPETSDLVVSDVITTSALGGRFPPGYPLGRVEAVLRQEQQTFALVDVTPASNLYGLRFVLILAPPSKQVVDHGAEP